MGLTLVVLYTLITYIWACPYPSDLVGEWYSTSFGTLTFTSTSFSGFTSAGVFSTPLTFTCYGQDGNKYVSSSTISLFGGTASIYLCMNLVRLSSIKYYFTLDSNVDTSGVRFYLSQSSSVSVAEVCTVTDTRSAGEYELLILKANISDALIPCPGSFTSFYTVLMNTITSTNCDNTTMEGRSGSQMVYNYSSCATGLFNSGGILQCLYYVVSGNGYLITYNNDTATDETSTFRFTCFTYYKYDAILYTTEHPRSCHTNQTLHYVNSPGITYVMTDIYYTETEDKNNLGLILGLVFGLIALIVIIILFIILYRKYCTKRPETPETPPPKIKKRKRKPSITEYSPNVSMKNVSDKRELIKRQSSEEILTGSLLNDKQMMNIDSEAGYDPPKKERWQKLWESKLRPGTPAIVSARRDVHSGMQSQPNGYIRQDSEKMSRKSSSLPDNLDRTSRTPDSKDKLKIEALDLETSRPSTRYSERYHATPKIPESTGKFGEQKSALPDATFYVPNTLQPIKENPLSRESTVSPVEFQPKTPKTLGTQSSFSTFDTFPRAYSTITASQSTVSAGDVHLNSLSKSGRYSHLSASNESIFDDPRWLTRSVTKSDRVFEVGKNLLPGIPQKSELDQKAFLKIPVNTEQKSREDMDYARAVVKTRHMKGKYTQSVGIRASLSDRSSSSQKIVEDEKRKRRKTTGSSKPKISWIYKWEHTLRPKSPFRSIIYKRRPTVTPSEESDRLSNNSPRHIDDADSDVNTDRTSPNPSFVSLNIAEETRSQAETPSTIPDLILTTPDDQTVSLTDNVSLANIEDTFIIENEFKQKDMKRDTRKRKRQTKAKEVNIHLDLLTGRFDDGRVSRLSTEDGRSLGSIKLLIINEDIDEAIDASNIVPEPVKSPNGEAIFKLKTTEDVDAISLSVRSTISVDEVTVDESIDSTSTMYSDVFLPEDWLFMYLEEDVIEKIWGQGAKRISKKRKHEVKCWLKTDEIVIDKRKKKVTKKY